jgi:glutathione S-transferase
MKAQYGSMPIATLQDGTEIQETMPISRMVAIELGQYPEDPLQGYENDRLMNIYYDLFNAMSGPQLSGDDKKISECAKAKLGPFLDSIEKRLGKSKWLVGDKICMVDFWVGSMYCDKLTNDLGKP